MSSWDVFHGDRLEVERGLDAGAVRDAFSRGELRPDDLIRPAGTTIAWARLAQFPELIASQVPAPELTLPPPPVAASPAPAKIRKQKQVADTELQASPKTAGREARPSGAGAGRAVAPAVSLNPRGEDEVGGLSDVTFPVINDQPAMKTPVAVQSKSFEPPPPGGWLWRRKSTTKRSQTATSIARVRAAGPPPAQRPWRRRTGSRSWTTTRRPRHRRGARPI